MGDSELAGFRNPRNKNMILKKLLTLFTERRVASYRQVLCYYFERRTRGCCPTACRNFETNL